MIRTTLFQALTHASEDKHTEAKNLLLSSWHSLEFERVAEFCGVARRYLKNP